MKRNTAPLNSSTRDRKCGCLNQKPLWTYPCCFFAKYCPSPFLVHVQLKPDGTGLDEFIKDADSWKREAVSQGSGLTKMCLFPVFTGIAAGAETQQRSPL